jgi:PilZ domain
MKAWCRRRHRRYRRVRLPRNVPATITSARGKYSSAISVLSLDGGLLSGDIQIPVGTEATLKIPAGLRSINMKAVVRFVRAHQAGFETVGMGLDDRAKLRRLLVSLDGANVLPPAPTPPIRVISPVAVAPNHPTFSVPEITELGIKTDRFHELNLTAVTGHMSGNPTQYKRARVVE